jgi:RNA polymerase-binding transcription factor DksA
MKPQINQQELQRYEQRLRESLNSLGDDAENVQEGSLRASGETHAERQDEAAEEAALKSDLAVLAAVDEQRLATADALRRIQDGTFGVCTSCNAPIERARLDVVPYASECAKCATARDRSASADA